MRIRTETTTAKTLYVQRMTRDGSVQLTPDREKAAELNRNEFPIAMRKLKQMQLVKSFSVF